MSKFRSKNLEASLMSFTCTLFCDQVRCFNQSNRALYGSFIIIPYKQRTIVPFLSELVSSQRENDWEICFSRSLDSWNDVTVVSSLLFLVSQFCTPPEVKFDAFSTSKHGEGKSLSKIFFAIHISTLRRFFRANK